MNDLQKKLLIVGITAFIVWLLMAIANDSFNYIDHMWFGYNLELFIKKAIWYKGVFSGYAGWIQTTTFITWLGSLIAFNIYKD